MAGWNVGIRVALPPGWSGDEMIYTWSRYTPVAVSIVSDGTYILPTWVTADDAAAAVELAKAKVLEVFPYVRYVGFERNPFSSEDEKAGPPYGYWLSTQRERLKAPWWMRLPGYRSRWFTRLRWRYRYWRIDRFLKKHPPKSFIR
jgi:hypothetical protein